MSRSITILKAEDKAYHAKLARQLAREEERERPDTERFLRRHGRELFGLLIDGRAYTLKELNARFFGDKDKTTMILQAIFDLAERRKLEWKSLDSLDGSSHFYIVNQKDNAESQRGGIPLVGRLSALLQRQSA